MGSRLPLSIERNKCNLCNEINLQIKFQAVMQYGPIPQIDWIAIKFKS